MPRLALLSAAFVASVPLVGPHLPSTGPHQSVVGAPGQTAAPRGATVRAVTCATSATCWAVGSETSGPGTVPLIDVTSDGAKHWAQEPPPTATTGGLTAIACSDPHHCMAVGATGSGPSAGLVAVTSDGGKHWPSTGAPAGAAGVEAVTCAVVECVVLATSASGWWAATTSDRGRVWQRDGTLPAGFGGAVDLVCRGATCMSAGYTTLTGGKGDGAVARSNDGGGTWSLATVPPGIGPLHALTCPTATSCVAVGTSSPNLADVASAPSVVITSDNGGATWASAAAPSGVGDAAAISCATALRCAMVGTAWTFTNPSNAVGAVANTINGGRTWRSTPHDPLPAGLDGVACPTVGDCVAVGGDELARVAVPARRR